MPMSPRKGESQSDFMHRCVPEMMGDDKREQEQAVAACMSIWREAHGGKKPSKSADAVARVIANWKEKFGADPAAAIVRAIKSAPYPEEDEDYDDFTQRCFDEVMETEDVSEEDAEQICEELWDKSERSAARKIIHKTHSGMVSGMEFVLSDETPDRIGDVIIAAGWDIANFAKNPIALFNHDPDRIVGRWHNLRAINGALRGHLELAPKGISARVDEIRKLVEHGFLKAVSVGFRPLESAPRHAEGKMAGLTYTKAELIETSLVSIPANPNALAVAKSLNISRATLDLVFAEQGNKGGSKTRGHGGHAATSNRRTSTMSTLSQKIVEAERRRVEHIDELEDHLKTIDNDDVSDEQYEKTKKLNAEIAKLDRALDMYRTSEKSLAQTTDGDNGSRERLPAKSRANGGNGADPRDTRSSPYFGTKKDPMPLDYFVRTGVCTYLSKVFQRSPEEIRVGIPHYNDEPTKALIDYMFRAAANPAMTTVTGWAAELVQQINVDFMELLVPQSVYPRLSAKGMALQFGRNGRIAIPTRAATPTIAGSFVGEGMPIPVRQGAFTAQVLTPKKMAVITTWTREIDIHSIPAIEGLLRNAIQEDTAVSLDAILLDAGAATTIRPAGILNGVTVTPGNAAATTPLDKFIADLKTLIGALTTTTKGNLRNLTFLMNPTDVLSMTLLHEAGVFPFLEGGGRLPPIIDAGTVTAKTVIAIDAADFVSVGAEGPRFEVSDQATLHEEDSSPQPITGGTPSPATPVRSLWQTDSLALRLILPVNWTIRRAGVVAAVNNVQW
jgi:HK97 family phage prohead protease/HK97 family phage major capsid protein